MDEEVLSWLAERALVGSVGWGAELLWRRDGVLRTRRLYGEKWDLDDVFAAGVAGSTAWIPLRFGAGEVVKPEFLRPVFPPRWRYDVLRALDHFWAVGELDDPRLDDALAWLRRKDGRRRVNAPYPGKVWFELEPRGGLSRWNTLRALRVLRA